MARKTMHNVRGRGRGAGRRGSTSEGSSWRASNNIHVQSVADAPSLNMESQRSKIPMEIHNEHLRSVNNQHGQAQEFENQNSNVVGDQDIDIDEDEAFMEEEELIDGRRVLTLIGNELLSSDRVSGAIHTTFKSRIDPLGSSWKKVSRETKEYYFEEFKKFYYWGDGMEVRVKKAWNQKASRRYSDMLSKAKRDNARPDFVPENTWKEWIKDWNTPEVKRLVEKNKKNRKGQNGAGSKHCGGSISSMEHMRRLEAELGRPPTLAELFVRLHTRKGDGISFVNAKSRALHDRMLALRQQQGKNGENVDDNQIYLEAAAGNRSDRVYGLGAVGVEYCRSKKYGSTAFASKSYTVKLENEIKELKQEIQQQRQEMEDRLQQQIQQQRQEMEDRVQELVRQMIPNMAKTSSSNNQPRSS